MYSKNGYANRNRIKTPEGSCWLTVPMVQKGIFRTPIRKVEISNTTNWRRKHWNAIKFNYGRAPHFEKYKAFFEEVYHANWVLLAELNKFLIKNVCSFLGINGTFIDASTLDASGAHTSLLVDICEAVNADTYYSGSAGRHYIRHELFEDRGIEVLFQDFQISPYPQLFGEFVPNLSAIDYLFNEGTSFSENRYM